MKVKLQTYVYQSTRTTAEIAAEMGFTEQRLNTWLRRENPIFVTIHLPRWEHIKSVTKEELLYECGAAQVAE